MTTNSSAFRASLKERLVKDEGLRLRPYVCTKSKLTIGVGRNLEDVGISEDEAMYLLSNDIDRVLTSCLIYPWFEALSDARKIVICSMIFNLGSERFKRFTNMISALEKADFDHASDCMMASLWASQVGRRAVILSDMMRQG